VFFHSWLKYPFVFSSVVMDTPSSSSSNDCHTLQPPAHGSPGAATASPTDVKPNLIEMAQIYLGEQDDSGRLYFWRLVASALNLECTLQTRPAFYFPSLLQNAIPRTQS
jgi:hypothetical protein